MTTTTRLTLKQFLEIPEQKPGLEFDADGSIHQKMSPNWDHGALQSHLAYLLWAWLYADAERRRGYVQTEFRTNVAGASKLPDVAFYRRRPRQSKRKHALEIANVSIEILSPADDPNCHSAKSSQCWTAELIQLRGHARKAFRDVVAPAVAHVLIGKGVLGAKARVLQAHVRPATRRGLQGPGDGGVQSMAVAL